MLNLQTLQNKLADGFETMYVYIEESTDFDTITVNIQKMLHIAEEEGLDLIEISPNANPPVCKIIDMGKYKYDLQKKANKAKKKQKILELKEIKLRPGTEIHDYNFKIKNAQKFLTKGNKVKFTVRFKGREMQHHHLGMELLKRVEGDLKEVDTNTVTIRRLDSNKQENMDLKLFLKKYSALNKAPSN